MTETYVNLHLSQEQRSLLAQLVNVKFVILNPLKISFILFQLQQNLIFSPASFSVPTYYLVDAWSIRTALIIYIDHAIVDKGRTIW